MALIKKKKLDKRERNEKEKQKHDKGSSAVSSSSSSSLNVAKKKKKKKQQQQQQQKSKVDQEKRALVENKKKSIVGDTPFEWDLSLAPTENDGKMKKRKREEEEEEESSGEEEESSSDEEEEEEEEEVKEGKEKRKKTLNATGDAPAEEQLVRQRETELASGRAIPQRDEDYERLIVGSPSNSFLWIQFMAFKLSMMDIDGARRIGERALRSISAQEEQDVFNMYAALMNLESKYGNEHTQKRIFDRAKTYCEPKQAYLQQAKVYEQNDDMDMAEEIFKRALKKFKFSRKVWEAYQLFEMRRGRQKEANALLERSLVSLPERKHIKTISKFALSQYKHGSIVQGNKLFEGIISSYPNRTDMWSMFIDMETSVRRYTHVRDIFERVVHVKMSTLRMKNFLQRYLKFEQEYGTEEGQEHVKKIAREYITMKKQA